MSAYPSFFKNAKGTTGKVGENAFVVGEIDAPVAKILKAHGVALKITAIVQRVKDVNHATRLAKGDKRIADEWLENLPQHLKKPDALLLDTTQKEAALLYIFKNEKGGVKKITVKLNCDLKHGKTANILRTSGIVSNPQGLKGANYILLGGEIFWIKK